VRSCVGRMAPMPMLPLGAPVIALATSAVVAQATPQPQQERAEGPVGAETSQFCLWWSSMVSGRLLTAQEIDKSVHPYITWRGQVDSTDHERQHASSRDPERGETACLYTAAWLAKGVDEVFICQN
jgi:hypothetical protein